MEKRELVKVLVSAVVLVRDGDRITSEAHTEPVACYNQEELAAFWERAEGEVRAFNAAQKPRGGRKR